MVLVSHTACECHKNESGLTSSLSAQVSQLRDISVGTLQILWKYQNSKERFVSNGTLGK